MPSEMGKACYRPQTCIREAAYADCRVTWRALTHIRDTHVPVEEPSTASRAEVGDLFDYLVGQQLERVRHGEAEGGGGLEINDQFVFDRELNGQIARI